MQTPVYMLPCSVLHVQVRCDVVCSVDFVSLSTEQPTA